MAAAASVWWPRVFLVAADAASYLLLLAIVLVYSIVGIHSVVVFVVLTPLAAARLWWLRLVGARVAAIVRGQRLRRSGFLL